MAASRTGRLTCTYRIELPDEASATELALAIAREQTIEVPAGVGGERLQERLLGRLEQIVTGADGAARATLSYPVELVGGGLPQILNVAYGNVSLMNGVRLVDLAVPSALLAGLPGPRHGLQGLRELVGADWDRPLVSVALKPVGLSTGDLAEIARRYVEGGADVIKDDHGLANQSFAPFRERVQAVADAVADANVAHGRRAAYFPNVTGESDTLDARLEWAESCGCRGVVICPALAGLDVVRGIAAGPRSVAIMAHPSHAQAAPGRSDGIAPDVLFGTLYRLAGADAVVYVNAGGRFAWSIETCEAINERLRAPLGSLRASFPVPAGGVQAAEAAEWLRRYGPDTMLLIGGSLLETDDLVAATRRVVRAAVGA